MAFYISNVFNLHVSTTLELIWEFSTNAFAFISQSEMGKKSEDRIRKERERDEMKRRERDNERERETE